MQGPHNPGNPGVVKNANSPSGGNDINIGGDLGWAFARVWRDGNSLCLTITDPEMIEDGVVERKARSVHVWSYDNIKKLQEFLTQALVAVSLREEVEPSEDLRDLPF